MLSKDWKGWVDPLNRCVGNLVEILRADGRSDTAIHNIVELIYFKERDEA
jgi:hypothetical protein